MNDLEREDFAVRCQLLHSQISRLECFEESPRVWTGVLTTLLSLISSNQANPIEALDQVISVMRNEVKRLAAESAKDKLSVGWVLIA